MLNAGSWRRGVAALAVAALLGACSSSGADTMSTGHPSLATARVALTGGSPAVALNICEGLLAGNGGDVGFLVCKGDALALLGRNAEAIAAYERALATDRGSSEAKLGLGRLSLAVNPVQAEALFLEALTSNPRNSAALNDLGIARDLQGKHAEAQVAYGEAIAAAPGERAPQVNLALSLAMSGRAGEAVRILRPIGEGRGATARERHNLAAALAMEGKTEEASRLLRVDLDGAQVDEALSGFQALPRR